jgi:peptide chain release factor 1
MIVLRSRIYEQMRQNEAAKRALLRSEQVGSGDRSERIRTYNYPQGRITDHRINASKFGIDKMMSGEMLQEFVDELLANDRRIQLQNI